jgi:hypothetical protein
MSGWWLRDGYRFVDVDVLVAGLEKALSGRAEIGQGG